jgi:hypothetical protein
MMAERGRVSPSDARDEMLALDGFSRQRWGAAFN